MFDIGFLELLVVFVLGLVVIGPERLPSTIKTCAIWFSRFKRSIQEARAEFEQQIGADDIRREIHNERVMESMRKFEEQRAALEDKVNDFKNEMEAAATTEESTQKSDASPQAQSHPDHTSHTDPTSDCRFCTHDENTEATVDKNADSEQIANPRKSADQEAEPHPPMVHDDSGTDVSGLPGRTTSAKKNETEEHGKQ